MKPPQKRPRGLYLRSTALLLFTCCIVLGLAQAARTWYHLSSAQATLGRLEKRLASTQMSAILALGGPDHLAAIRSDLARLDHNLSTLESISRPVLSLSPHLGWLPVWGADIEALPQLLILGQQTARASLALIDVLGPLSSSAPEVGPGFKGLGPVLVQTAGEALPSIREAQHAITLATDAREAIDVTRLGSRLRSIVDRFDYYQPPLATGLRILALVPSVLGAESERNYLILAQNSHELRATGGFISGVGLVQVRGGRIEQLSFRDSYTVDDLTQLHPSPPAALRREMGADILLLRDANWWPDFPTSAQAVSALYSQDQGATVDGVIAADLASLRLMVGVLGPVEIPGYDKAVTTSNLESMMMAYWEAPRSTPPGKDETDWWAHRKDFAADLMSALLDQAMEGEDADTLAALVENIGTALEEKHLLIYFSDPNAQALVQELQWGGVIGSWEGDYLMVIDSNTGFNKVNPNVEQTLDYAVTVDEDGSAMARLSLSYRHRIQRPTPACVHEARYGESYADLMERCYWDHVRVYLPAGTETVKGHGSDGPTAVYPECGRTVFSGSFLLETGQSRQIELAYQPNIPKDSQSYRLLLQKQPGTDSLPYRISVRLPAGTKPVRAYPPGAVWTDGIVVWQGATATDLEIELSWDRDA